MSHILYMVTATLPDDATSSEYLAWLHGGHVRDVLQHGAISGTVVRLDRDAGGRSRVMTQYLYPTRAAYDAYVRDHAPALRADGLKSFPPERGITFARDVGVIDIA